MISNIPLHAAAVSLAGTGTRQSWATMLHSPDLEVITDPIISSDLAVFSVSRSTSRVVAGPDGQISQSVSQSTRPGTQPRMSSDVLSAITENEPLLGGQPRKKAFHRARPLWLVPFAVTASLVRGMTLAPRVQVFTQLSCSAIYDHHYNHTTLAPNPSHFHFSTLLHNLSPSSHLYLDPLSLDPLAINPSINLPHTAVSFDDNEDNDDPRELPSRRCLSDPKVQGRAAQLQSMMTVIMGTLSALTTGWWGHFGEQHGRTRVLAISTLGLFLTDLTFILVSTPHNAFSGHGHKLLIIAPIIEGLLGGWSTLQGATSAYISDCTSDGSRSHIFSRFTGVFYLGFALGPVIGAFLIRHHFFTVSDSDPGLGLHPLTVTSVFWVAVFCSFLNLMLVLFVFPESLTEEKRIAAKEKRAVASAADAAAGKSGGLLGFLKNFLRPLAIFLPTKKELPGGGFQKNWNLTLLACALFGYFLSTGIFQIKYLYAGHVYGWGAEQLSYYISFAGGLRAVNLLFLMPFIIAVFKPQLKPQPKPLTATSNPTAGASTTKKPKPTIAQLAHEIHFDLVLVRLSIIGDVLSHVLVSVAPIDDSFRSQAMFVGFSSLSSLASGVVPVVQSLALCIMQTNGDDAGTGQLFGAMASLQAVGQMILGPMLFAVIYSGTVAVFPKAIFTSAAAILAVSLVLICMLSPTVEVKPKRKLRRGRLEIDIERGRSRASKDLTGGAAHRQSGSSRVEESS